jgi:hypothetical protein
LGSSPSIVAAKAVIRLVERSHLPARRTLDMLGIKPSTFYR